MGARECCRDYQHPGWTRWTLPHTHKHRDRHIIRTLNSACLSWITCATFHITVCSCWQLRNFVLQCCEWVTLWAWCLYVQAGAKSRATTLPHSGIQAHHKLCQATEGYKMYIQLSLFQGDQQKSTSANDIPPLVSIETGKYWQEKKPSDAECRLRCSVTHPGSLLS